MSTKIRVSIFTLTIIIVITLIVVMYKHQKNEEVVNNDLIYVNLEDEDLKKATEEFKLPLKDSTEKDNQMELFYEGLNNMPQDVKIIVYKGKRVLELYGSDELIGRFKVYLGQNSKGDKEKQGDYKTPEGNYYICTINNQSKFKLFLGLSYPNIKDAKRGLENGLINSEIFQEIETDINNVKRPIWDSQLGGAIGIHGVGTFKGDWQKDWTAGCIAVSDEDIDIIGKYVKYGTEVEIVP